MSFDVKSAQAAWAAIKPGAWHHLPACIKIADMPSFPLAPAVAMPQDRLPQANRFPLGSLALRLQQLQIGNGYGWAPKFHEAVVEGGHMRASVQFAPTVIRGSHSLQGKQVWHSGIDGAGTGLALDDEGHIRPPGGTAPNKHPTWIATANAQRAWLAEQGGDNGASFLDTYTNHRNALSDVLTKESGYTFQVGWGIPAIGAMAAHTNETLNHGGDINTDKTYENGMTYNGNASHQQFSLITALQGMGATLPNGDPDPKCPYQKAITATLGFRGWVLENTNATKIDVIPTQSVTGVKALVKTGKPIPRLSVQEAYRFLDGEEIGGRSADGKQWSMVLSEDERALLRHLKADWQMHQERMAAAKPVALCRGSVHADLPGFWLYIAWRVDASGQLTFADARVELDCFDLNLDDADWPEKLGAIARNELVKARFIRSLLHDRVADALERDLARPIAETLVKALEQSC